MRRQKMKSERIYEFMEEIAPKSGAMDFDNVGLLVGRRDKEVTRVLTALDCTMEVVCEAKRKNCELILCHHPVMFSKIGRINDDTKEGEMLLYAIENNISIFAAHTNLDFAEGGLNDFFLEKLGFCATDTIEESCGRVFDCEITAKKLCERIKTVFGIEKLRVCIDSDKLILKGAVCTGSGKSLAEMAAAKADVYITGEMGHHDILNLAASDCGYIEISHYDSEKIVMELIRKHLEKKFGDELVVFLSEENKNPLTII